MSEESEKRCGQSPVPCLRYARHSSHWLGVLNVFLAVYQSLTGGLVVEIRVSQPQPVRSTAADSYGGVTPDDMPSSSCSSDWQSGNDGNTRYEKE